MCTLNQKFRPHPEVVDTELDENEVVLLHLESKTYYSLNLTAAQIWQGLKQGLTPKEISQHLQDAFEVEADKADHSVLALIDELSRQKLIRGLE